MVDVSQVVFRDGRRQSSAEEHLSSRGCDSGTSATAESEASKPQPSEVAHTPSNAPCAQALAVASAFSCRVRALAVAPAFSCRCGSSLQTAACELRKRPSRTFSDWIDGACGFPCCHAARSSGSSVAACSAPVHAKWATVATHLLRDICSQERYDRVFMRATDNAQPQADAQVYLLITAHRQRTSCADGPVELWPARSTRPAVLSCYLACRACSPGRGLSEQ